MNGEKVLEILRKLVAHEKSARTVGSLAEADAFAARIQTLLAEHKLGMSDVEFADREANEPIDWTPVDPQEAGLHTTKKGRVPWQVFLASNIADANTCQVVLGIGNRLYFVGRTSDRELCRVFFLYMLELAKELAEKSARENMEEQRQMFREHKGYATETRFNRWDTQRVKREKPREFLAWMQDYRKAWYNGFAGVVGERIEEKAKLAKEGANSNAIVHIDRDRLAVAEAVDSQAKETKFSGSLGRNMLAMMRGAVTGGSVALTPHTFKHTPQSNLLLGDG